MERIVLAYSGSLETSVAAAWLAEHYGAEVVTLTLDLGQGGELRDVRDRALADGAVRAHVLDVREEFAREYLLPALQAGALQDGRDPLPLALGRPIIARKLLEVAALEDATAIAHGCTDRSDDQVRIEAAARGLRPGIRVIAPGRLCGMSDADRIEYARQRRMPLPGTAARPFSASANLWGRSVEAGTLADAWVDPPEEVFALTTAPDRSPDVPACVEIDFDEGVPSRINGVALPLTELVTSLATIAGDHGVGRIDLVEDSLAGPRTRELYEAPAAVVLHAAHRELERLVLPVDLLRVKQQLAAAYADLVRNGRWFTPLREAIDGFVVRSQQRVTGTIRLRLFKGNAVVVGRRSPFGLDEAATPAGETGRPFDAAEAGGFASIYGGPPETAARDQPPGARSRPGSRRGLQPGGRPS